MLSRTIVIAAVISASFSPWSVRPVHAQGLSAVPVSGAQLASTTLQASVAAAAQPGQVPTLIGREEPKPGGGSLGMRSLYVSTVALQALDVHSTMAAINQGGAEGNPMMRGITSNKAVFVATKAAVATTTIVVANRIAKRNKTTAMIFLAAVNSVYFAVVMHNYKVARGLR
jgi:hypothetical protein